MAATILGKSVEFDLELEDAEQQRARVTAMFGEMVSLINGLAGRWSDRQADTFRLTNRFVIFRKNEYRGRTMTRSYMAVRERDFFWTFDEFVKCEPGRRRPTAYYHDAWHVQQYLDHGPGPSDEEVLIDREQDAIRRQLEVADKLHCDAQLIAFLCRHANDREGIRELLRAGAGARARIAPQFLVLD